MNKKKSLITALLLVVVAGLSITAGTFAYFQWTTGTEGGTQVNVTIEMGGITMHIEPETTEFVGLYPTAHCENNVRYGDALVTIVNNTGTLAIPSFKLKVRVTDKDGNGVPKSALEHINYAVVPIKTTKDAQGNPLKGDTGSYSCSNVPVVDDAADSWNLLTNAPGYVDTSFNFENVSVNGDFTHVPSEGDMSLGGLAALSSGYLPRQYYIGDSEATGFYKGDVNGITFRGESYTTSYQYFRVYVWVDDGYTSTIVGNVVSDPLQNAKIEITWSEESMVQQVSGESNVEELEPGLYDEDGTLVLTWDDLTFQDNYITINGTTITSTSEFGDNINQILLIPDEITIIEDHAFRNSKLSEIKFSKNSNLTNINQYAFASSSIHKIEIPANVTYIGAYAFDGGSFGDGLTFAPNSKITTIGSEAFYSAGLTSIKIPASVTYIDGYAFEGNDFTRVEFEGTVEQWNEISIDTHGNEPLLSSDIICSNGTVISTQ